MTRVAMSIEERRRRKAAYSREWHKRNPDRSRAASARYRAQNPDRVKHNNNVAKLRRYGLTVEDYERILDGQGGGCAVCGASERRLCVDHDHACCPGDASCGRCVRGLLCGNCNRAIGIMADDANRLRAAATYLDCARPDPNPQPKEGPT